MSVTCHSCDGEFPDYHALAMHISTAQHGHNSGKKWAAKYILLNGLSAAARKDRDNGRVPLPENYKENKASTQLMLSGENKVVNTTCPRCSVNMHKALPVEFVNLPLAWRVNGNIARICSNCGGKE